MPASDSLKVYSTWDTWSGDFITKMYERNCMYEVSAQDQAERAPLQVDVRYSEARQRARQLWPLCPPPLSLCS